MKWNNRLLDRSHLNNGEPWLEVIEVYYEDDGTPTSWCDPSINSETKEGIIRNLKRMIADIENSPVLTLKDFGLTEEDDKRLHSEICEEK